MRDKLLPCALSQAVFAFLLSMLAMPQAVAVTVNVTNNFSFTRATDGGELSDFEFSTALPHSDTLAASQGNSSSQLVVDWQSSATGALLDYSMTHSFDNSGGSLGTLCSTTACDGADSQGVTIDFTVSGNTTYDLSGNYDASITDGGRIFSRVTLRDVTTATTLFDDITQSVSAGNLSQNMLLGVAGDGNLSNITVGSLTGNLLAGRTYRLEYALFIQAAIFDSNPPFDRISTLGSGSATGQFALEIVPEPSTFVLAGLGLFALSARRKRA